jgi:hypothetical protein
LVFESAMNDAVREQLRAVADRHAAAIREAVPGARAVAYQSQTPHFLALISVQSTGPSGSIASTLSISTTHGVIMAVEVDPEEGPSLAELIEPEVPLKRGSPELARVAAGFAARAEAFLNLALPQIVRALTG